MNVILIISDTMRRDHLGCYGNPWIKTPNLDRFAAGANVFERAFTGSFPTVPLRNDIMTGRYTFTYKDWSPLGDEEVVLSECLRKAGIYTGLIADTPHPFRPGYQHQRGFHTWDVIRGQENDEWRPGPADEDLPWPCEPSKLRGGKNGAAAQHMRNNLMRRTEADYLCARTMIAASQWIETNRRKPFFLYVDTFDPHEPWDPPQAYVDLYDPGYTGEKVNYPRYDYADYLTPAELKHCRAMYAGECTLVDRWVGHLLGAVDAVGLAEETTVIFLSDHGFYLGEHGVIGKGLIRDAKLQTLPLYPEVSQIPFMIRLPGQTQGRRLKALAQPTDLMPTILDLFGADIPKTVRSKSLKPVLDGTQDQVHEITVTSPTLYTPRMETPLRSRRSTITDGRWLLVYGAQVDAQATGGAGTPMVDNIARSEQILERTPIVPELYDLEADPTCTKNVLERHRAQARRLHKLYVAKLEAEGLPAAYLSYFRHEP